MLTLDQRGGGIVFYLKKLHHVRPNCSKERKKNGTEKFENKKGKRQNLYVRKKKKRAAKEKREGGKKRLRSHGW